MRPRNILFAALLLMAAPPLLFADDIDAAKAQLEQLRQRIGKLQSTLDSAQKTRQALLQELRSTERRIGRAALDLRQVSKALQQQRQRLDRLRSERSDQQRNLAVQQEALRKQVRSAYAMGRQERVKILLNQQDPVMVSRIMVYYDYLNQARIERAREIDRILEMLRRTEAQIALEEGRLLELRKKKENDIQHLELARVGRQEVMTALTADIRSKGKELSGLQTDEKGLQELLQRLRRELAERPVDSVTRKPFRALKGKMKWPSRGVLAARFGADKGSGLRWDGVVISAQEGSEVRAVYHGRVVFADWLRGFGLLLIIDHGNGYMTLYGHNQALFKETGEWVEAEEPVALVGSSGGRLKTGLYFEVRYEGRPVNPKAWCRPVKGNRVSGPVNRDRFEVGRLIGNRA
jgi:septal ring factor EnvC (AmiA/AmiB activator)